MKEDRKKERKISVPIPPHSSGPEGDPYVKRKESQTVKLVNTDNIQLQLYY